MTLGSVLRVQGNYPDNMTITSAGPDEHGKFQGFAYINKDGEPHSLLVSTTVEFGSKEAAEKYLHDTFIQFCKMEMVDGELVDPAAKNETDNNQNQSHAESNI